MRIVALVGKSGTGKSHHAAELAQKKGTEAIIDDGLLIYSNKVVAGKSAKREQNIMASVKRALFMDPRHVEDVRRGIKENKIENILLLGTSDRMADRIAETLGLGKVSEYVRIEDISTPEDIAIAQNLRMTQGKHIIPVPTFAIKNEFSGYFLHPLRIFAKRNGKKEQIDVKSIVRPTYSYMGEYSISDNVIKQVVVYETEKIENVIKSGNIIVNKNYGVVEINITVTLKYGCIIKCVCKEIGEVISKQVEKMTAINLCKIDVFVKSMIKPSMPDKSSLLLKDDHKNG